MFRPVDHGGNEIIFKKGIEPLTAEIPRYGDIVLMP